MAEILFYNNAARLQMSRMREYFSHVFRLVSFCDYFHFQLSDLVLKNRVVSFIFEMQDVYS